MTSPASPAGAPGDSRIEDLSAAVLTRREALGLRQAELADLAGCSERFVHTVEHGKATLRLDKVLDVLEVLGLDLVLGPGRGRIRLDEEGSGSARRALDGEGSAAARSRLGEEHSG